MDSKDFKCIKKTQQEEGSSIPKKKFIVQRGMIEHIENDQLEITQFRSSNREAKITFLFNNDEEKIKLIYELELIEDTLILEFKGGHLTDEMRFMASKIMEKLIEALRFKHKDKEWMVSKYYIDGKEEYENRKTSDWVEFLKEELPKIRKITKHQAMSEDNHFFFSIEEIHDLSLRVVGEDGLILCRTLQDLKIATFKKVNLNEYEIDFIGDEESLDLVNQKIIFSREMLNLGYITWVDYEEDK